MGQEQLCNVLKKLQNYCQCFTRFGGDLTPSTYKKFPLPTREVPPDLLLLHDVAKKKVLVLILSTNGNGPGERKTLSEERLLLLGLDR